MTMKTDNCTGPTLVTFALSPIFKAVNIAMKNRNTWYQRYFFTFFIIAASIMTASFL